MKKNQSASVVDEQHHKLVEAIINGNVEEAELAMSQHMETIEQYLDEIQKEQQQGRR